MFLLGDVGAQRSICSGCRKADVQCNTALRIRVEGSSTQRWNGTVREGGSPLAQVPSSGLGTLLEKTSRQNPGTRNQADTATAPAERSSDVLPRHISSQDASSTGQAGAPQSSIRTASGSTLYHAFSEHPAGDASLSVFDKAFSSDNSHVLPNACKSDNAVVEEVSADALSPNTATQRVGPCLWPVGEVESRLIKYFFNVLVAWVSKSIPRRKMLICPSHLSNFDSYFGVILV